MNPGKSYSSRIDVKKQLTNSTIVKSIIETCSDLSEIKDNIVIDFKTLQRIHSEKFQSNKQEYVLVVNQFQDDRIKDIIKDFMIYMILYSNEELHGQAKILTQLKNEIKHLYRTIVENLFSKIKDYMKILIVISYFMFYLLIHDCYFDDSANHINFLVFCFEIVHYEINGVNIGTEALSETIIHKFKHNYKVPVRLNLAQKTKIVPSHYDILMKQRLDKPSFNRKRKRSTMNHYSQFQRNLASKAATIQDSYKNTINDFKENFEKYRRTKNKSFEVQHFRFRKMKLQRYKSYDDKTIKKIFKDKIDINSISQGLLLNTKNPKNKHYMSKIKRHNESRKKNRFPI